MRNRSPESRDGIIHLQSPTVEGTGNDRQKTEIYVLGNICGEEAWSSDSSGDGDSYLLLCDAV